MSDTGLGSSSALESAQQTVRLVRNNRVEALEIRLDHITPRTVAALFNVSVL